MTDIHTVEKALWDQRRLSPKAIGLRAVAALILAFVTILLIQKTVDKFSGPDSYRIVMAGDFDDGERSASYILREAIKNQCEPELSNMRLDGRTIEFSEQNHIAGNAALTAETVASRDDTLMVIGHFSSTASSKTLPVYLSRSPAIPVILTIETNPKLTDFAGDARQPVVRLWPTDKDQAQTAADFALKEHENFWVVRDDTSNPVYSGYLADEFTKNVLANRKRVVLRSENRTLPSPQILRGYDIDVVFFAGGWQDSLMLIHTVRDTWGNDPMNAPKVILTDAVADEARNLLTIGEDAVEGIFVTHPAPAGTYMERGQYEEQTWNKGVQAKLGYKACEQIKDLIEDAANKVINFKPRLLRVFNHHSLSYSRQAVAQAALSEEAPSDNGFVVWRATRKGENMIVFEDHKTPNDERQATVAPASDAASVSE